MNNIFYKFNNYFKNRKLILFGFLFLLISTLLYFSLQLHLEEDITKLIPESEETKTLNAVLKNTDFSDNIIVNISVDIDGTTNDLNSYALEIIDSLRTHCQQYILNIQGQIADDEMVNTMDFIYTNLPLFLDESDYQYIQQKLSRENLYNVVQDNYKTLISPGGLITKNSLRSDPFGLTFRGLGKLNSLKITNDLIIHNGFLVTKSKKNLLLFIKPALPTNETDANTEFVKELFRISDGLNKKYKNIANSEYFGSTVIAVSNANQIKTDVKYTVTFAIAILLLILIFFYKRLTIPIILFVPTVIGALIAIVSLHFIRDNISAISLGIGSVLLGITLDYSLHILTHYKKNNNVERLFKDVTKPILMSSITTAAAFLCLLFLKSQALQDLGIFAAISVLSTSVFALLLIPLLYDPKQRKDRVSNNFIERIANYPYDRNKILITSVFLIFILSFFTYNNVKFNKDLNSMNYLSEATRSAELHLDSILKLSSKSIYIVAYGDEMDDVLEANTEINRALEKAQNTKDIIQYSSNGSVVLSSFEQEKKIAYWNAFWTDSVKEQLKNDLIKVGKNVGFRENTYLPFYNLLNKEFTELGIKDYSQIKTLMTEEYISDTKDLKTAVSLVKLEESKKVILKRIVDNIPNTILIDRKQISETFLGGLKDNFSSLINYSLLAIVVILLLFFRNIELTLMTIFPIMLTWVLTLGVMGYFNIEFTIFNVIITTFIFGLGVDYSIFMTNALVKDYTYGTNEITTYKVSIILSVITTILGVGVLIFAKHPALRSISILSLIGILITVLVTFTIQPLIFRIFVKNRAEKGFAPLKTRSFINSVFSLFIYGFGGIILSLFSITVLPLLPISKKVKFKWLHNIVAKLVTFVLYTNPFVSKKVVNSINEKFDDPAIIIANHSSSLDTLAFGLLTPKIIYLVNDWVFRSPVFGLLARVMGYYPITTGVDNSPKPLQEKIRQAYSLVIFPESRRSFSNKIGRFHKGAFFLQEQLKLDMIPVYIHGNSEVMPKGDLIIHDGSITVIVGERIAYDDKNFGTTYKERNKKIGKFFKSEFMKIRNEFEGDDYFKRILLSNYIYKDTNILKLIKNDFEKNKGSYHKLNLELPMKSKILHIADDYGQRDILLVSRSLNRKITSFIFDKEKRNIARNCYTNSHRRVNHVSNIKELNMGYFDTLLLTNAKSEEIIDTSKIINFNHVVIVDQIFPLENILSLGYEIRNEIENIVLLEKNTS